MCTTVNHYSYNTYHGDFVLQITLRRRHYPLVLRKYSCLPHGQQIGMCLFSTRGANAIYVQTLFNNICQLIISIVVKTAVVNHGMFYISFQYCTYMNYSYLHNLNIFLDSSIGPAMLTVLDFRGHLFSGAKTTFFS